MIPEVDILALKQVMVGTCAFLTFHEITCSEIVPWKRKISYIIITIVIIYIPLQLVTVNTSRVGSC